MSNVAMRAGLSGAGQIATALLGRLPSALDLDPLAHPHAHRILAGLVAPSRKKLAQRVRAELQRTELADVDERVVVDLLRDEGLFAELDPHPG